MTNPAVLPGTLEMLILKIVSARPEHGWGIGQRLGEVSEGVFDVIPGVALPGPSTAHA